MSLDAVVTSSPDRAGDVRQRYPRATVFPDTETLFERSQDFDLVIIASPHETHAPLAVNAIQRGLHVVVDKPIAVRSAAASEVVARAAAAGVKLSVFQNRRWDGDFLTVRAILERGELGEIRQFDSAFEWWKPSLRDRWKDRARPEDGGGLLYDLGPHLIDQALQLFGPAASVHAERDIRRPDGVNDDDTFVSMLHESGVRTRLWMSAVAPARRPRFRVMGSLGVLETKGLDPQEHQLAAGLLPGDEGFGLHGDARVARLENEHDVCAIPLQAGCYQDYYRRLVAFLSNVGPNPVDPLDSVLGLTLIEGCT